MHTHEMVASRRSGAIRRIPFVSPLPLGMEVMTLARLRAMAPPRVLARPLRSDFHSLLLIADGAATHAVDFTEYRLARGSVLWIKPGQVQQYGEDRLAGDLVIFESEFLIPGTRVATIADDPLCRANAHNPTGHASIERSRRALRRAYAEMAHEGVPTVARAETLRYLLGVLILSLDSDAPDAARSDSDKLDSRFRVLLERDFRSSHDADHYARQLGYSRRTLNRATQATADESPKQAVSRRLVLEARRLLAHTDRPVAAIARELGFTDPSNFSRFFTRQTDETPSAFRAHL